MSLKLKVEAPNQNINEPAPSDSDITDVENREKTELAALNAKTEDQRALTRLKESLAHNVLFFMWMWCGFIFLGLMTYFSSQLSLGKEIPKEVILGLLTSTTVVIGLVGFILKGLFGSK
ncbi:hypothetical protein P7L92_23400 [Vibrio parahaemolyticus]|uniref:hypothetical protein n=1 Tax=Vibrio parahaemolyticus TaxID=670 RepID=UPI0032979987|nr:hypothetical protein [Vibrio parahaemolyticus]MDG2783999.1 hypothetical protein [Vibrio parahaemolyticus]